MNATQINALFDGAALVKTRKTPAQKKALDAYKFAELQEDRYLTSVFANANGQLAYEAKTAAACAECKRLGMTGAHGFW